MGCDIENLYSHETSLIVQIKEIVQLIFIRSDCHAWGLMLPWSGCRGIVGRCFGYLPTNWGNWNCEKKIQERET